MRVLIDYRAALRQRSGVGEYTHQLVAALLAAYPPGGDGPPLALTLFSSSWKDRLALDPPLSGTPSIDRRVPVRVLNFAWHRLGWPAVESLTDRRFDVTHSLHPLLLPSRTAAKVVTIHDLYFLAHPELSGAEIRRDYPALVRRHAGRADHIVVPSKFTASQVDRLLNVPPDRVSVCSPGAPDWPPRSGLPADGYVLFFGTLEPRKNVGALLDAYELLIERRRPVPPLVVAGRATDAARPWLDRIGRAPLDRVVRYVGYVDPDERRALYEGARMLVQPSHEEGFGIPVLEAMTIGVPVVAADRGALPEVLGDAGTLVDPSNREDLADAIERMATDDAYAEACASKGAMRARDFSWSRTARHVYRAYQLALEHRRCASA